MIIIDGYFKCIFVNETISDFIEYWLILHYIDLAFLSRGLLLYLPLFFVIYHHIFVWEDVISLQPLNKSYCSLRWKTPHPSLLEFIIINTNSQSIYP